MIDGKDNIPLDAPCKKEWDEYVDANRQFTAGRVGRDEWEGLKLAANEHAEKWKEKHSNCPNPEEFHKPND